ncbi:MAG: hypothetical protein CSB48_08640 [Proteobacteria bacterium]|nr:MAG: hypothetical protein CSB48_08640 [Pseudomonadota bacterium]
MKLSPLQAAGRLLLAFIIFFSGIQTSHAFTYVMMRDSDLLSQSELVIVGKVIKATELANEHNVLFATEYLFRVADTIKGQPYETVTVRVPGVQQPGPDSIYLHSAPHFSNDDQALLFLGRHSDGYYQPRQYALGVFSIKKWDEQLYAVRDLYGTDLSPVARHSYTEPANVRQLAPFTTWLKSRANQETKRPAGRKRSLDSDHSKGSGDQAVTDDYYVTDPLLKSRLSGLLTPRFTMIRSGTGFRWTDFDNGLTVVWQHNGGWAYKDQMAQALAAWSNATGSNISMRLGGSTKADSGLTASDEINTILFNDPNDEINGAYECGVGGTLGMGGPFSVGIHKYNGTTYNTTVEGDLVINDDAECFLDQFNKANAAEIIGHEIGHTLGFGHSCGDASSGPCDDNPTGDADALMRATAHDDGRGASLGRDDILAAAFLYKSNAAPANQPPVISAISNQTIDQDRSTDAIGFTIFDPDGEINNATVTTSSSNTDLVGDNSIQLAGSGNNRTITVTPSPGKSGSARITITVTDEHQGTASTTFTLTVNEVINNQPPTISSIADQTVAENGSVGPISFTIADPDNAATELVVMAASSNVLLIPNQNIQLGGTGSTRTVTLFPLLSSTGSTQITLSVSDGELSASTSFTATVVAPDLPPVISSIPNQIITMNSSTEALAFQAEDPDGGEQTLLITASSDNIRLIPDQNILISGTGPGYRIKATPVKDVTGIVNITVTASDGKLSASTAFTIEIKGSTVTGNTGDSGAGSLRSAILSATEGSRISFDGTAFPQDRNPDNNPVIQLDSPLIIESGVTINGDIDGDGIPDVTIAGSNTGLMQVTTSTEVGLNGLVLTDSEAAQGGALSVTGGGTVNIGHSIIRNNTADSGGGIFNQAGLVRIVNSTLSGNISGQGGGILLDGSNAQVTIENSVFDSNASLGNGGAILNAGGVLQLDNAVFSDNSSDGDGGALYTASGGQVSINNVTISENTAGSGAGVAQQGGSTSITNSIIAGNSLRATSGFSALTDSTFSDNRSAYSRSGKKSDANSDGADVSVTGGSMTVSYSGIKKISGHFTDTGTNLFSTDMMLEPASISGFKKVYRLKAGSPAIDAGDSNTPGQGGSCSPVDITGKPRPIDGDGDFIAICDIGAFEYDVISDTGNRAERVATVQEQYIAFYGRPGDPGGVRFWVGELESAGTLSAIQNRFGTSAEFSRLIVPGNATTVDELTREQKGELINNLYLNMFGRGVEGSADDPATGLGFWTAELEKPEVSLIDISTRIADGAINEDDTVLGLRVELAQRITEEFVLQSKRYTEMHIPRIRTFIFDNIDDANDDPASLDVESLVRGLQ